jgi:hypothetical protein
MFNGLRIKVVYSCANCGHTERLLNLAYALRGFRCIFSKEGQELSSKIVKGQERHEELHRYHELVGLKKLLACRKCGASPARWNKSWDFGNSQMKAAGPS